MLIDLARHEFAPADAPSWQHFDWQELAHLWDGNDLAAAHDWLNERWSGLVRNRTGGQADPEARFLQALAYAVLALHFTQIGNQAGARVVLDDALITLAAYRPSFLGVRIDPIYATLDELKPMLAGLADDDPCPMFPFVYRKFEYDR
jgi:uncharacterized protein